MKIRAGYAIGYECPQATPMILCLSVHPSRRPDLVTPDRMRLHPDVPTTVYRDGFDNICHVIKAPPGHTTISSDFLIEDSGMPEDVAPEDGYHPLDRLPVETLVYLLGSRYCETDRLSDFAWARFGHEPKGGSLVQAICDFVHNQIEFGYEHANPTKTAFDTFEERRGVCRDFAHLAITICRCMNIPARYCTGYLGDIGVPPNAHGFQCLVRGIYRRPLVHIRRQAQSAAHRTHPHRARPRCHRCRHGDLVRTA